MRWAIPGDRFEVELSREMPIWTDQFPSDNLQANHLSNCVIGYSHVVRKNSRLTESAKGITWQMVAKELVKGTAELICLHGLSQLLDQTY